MKMTEERVVKIVNNQIKTITRIIIEWHSADIKNKGKVYAILSEYVNSIIESNSLCEDHDINGILVSNLEARIEALYIINGARPTRKDGYDLIDRIEHFYNDAKKIIVNSDYYKNKRRSK